jgi:hypothetical protein
MIYGRKVAQLEKEIASSNGVVQATKETFEEERIRFLKEIESEREKTQADRLKHEAGYDNLKKQLADKGIKIGKSSPKPLIGEDEEHSAGYYMSHIISEIRDHHKECDGMATKLNYDKKIKESEVNHQEQMANLKTQLKHVFNLDLQNMKLTYEHQLKQAKKAMKDQEQEIEVLKSEIIKKDSEVCLLRETNKHFENERRMYSEQSEFLSRVL